VNYRPKHFILQELVGPGVFEARGDRAFELLRPEALVTLDALREKFGPLTVNNWHAGGAFKESGLRDFTTATGAKYSMHRYGGAFDCKFQSLVTHEVYDYVLANRGEFPLITTVENVKFTATWLHFDVRNHDQGAGIWVVDP